MSASVLGVVGGLKVLIVGNTGVGKSTLINTLSDTREGDDGYRGTSSLAPMTVGTAEREIVFNTAQLREIQAGAAQADHGLGLDAAGAIDVGNDLRFTLVDTEGFGALETASTDDLAGQRIAAENRILTSLQNVAGPVDLVILAISLENRWNKDNTNLINLINQALGIEVWGKTLVAFTKSDYNIFSGEQFRALFAARKRDLQRIFRNLNVGEFGEQFVVPTALNNPVNGFSLFQIHDWRRDFFMACLARVSEDARPAFTAILWNKLDEERRILEETRKVSTDLQKDLIHSREVLQIFKDTADESARLAALYSEKSAEYVQAARNFQRAKSDRIERVDEENKERDRRKKEFNRTINSKRQRAIYENARN